MNAKYRFVQKFHDQLIHCSRCGFCQVACPVYGATLRPALNPRGKMLILKDLLEGRLELSDELLEAFYHCTGCAVCAHHCPAGVKVADILREARKDMVQNGFSHPAFLAMAETLNTQTNIYGEKKDLLFQGRRKNQPAEIVFFIGCVGAFREVESTLQTLNLLDRLDVNYTLIDEVCCSGVLEEVGFDLNPNLAAHNIEAILATSAKRVLLECPFCFRTFTGKPQYDPLRAEKIEILHLTQFLKDFQFGVRTDQRVTYHDPCDLGRHSGIYEEPREIIRKLAPDFVEMAHNREEALCCGAGGGVRGAFPGASIAMAGLRLQEAVDIGADIVLTHCNACLHNFGNAQKRYAHLRKQKRAVYNLSHFINLLLDQAG
jgi:Fe-S oxidoreductase